MAKQKDKVKERIMSHFAKEMKDALDKRGWTQSQLKSEAGVSVDRYNDKEDGREPTLSSAVRIADALNISLDQLCGRTQYIKDLNNLNAGDCLELILVLLDRLGGNVFSNGDEVGICLPPSNVSCVLDDLVEDRTRYEEFYELSNYFPGTKLKSVSEHTRTFLEEKIAAMKNSEEPIQQKELHGNNGFKCFDGTIILSADNQEKSPDDAFPDNSACGEDNDLPF